MMIIIIIIICHNNNNNNNNNNSNNNNTIGVDTSTELIQRSVLLASARILRKVLEM